MLCGTPALAQKAGPRLVSVGFALPRGMGERMASLSTSISGGDFSIGALISGTFSVLHGALPKFLALSAIPLVPSLLLLLFGGVPTADNAGSYGLLAGATSLVGGVLLFMIQGATVFAAVNEIRGRSFTVGEALSKGLARFWPLLGVAIVASICIGLGALLLLVPGLILLCMWYAASAVCVVEKEGIGSSLSRSSWLTKGYRWKIFALILIVGIAGAIVGAIVGGVGAAVGGFWIARLVSLVVQLYANAFGSVLIALTYYSLRAIKEGVDIDRIADVFN